MPTCAGRCGAGKTTSTPCSGRCRAGRRLAASGAPSNRACAPAPPPWWRGLAFWRIASGALAALLVAGVVIYPMQVDRAARAQLMAVLQSPEAQAMLVVRADEAGGLRIQALQNLATRAGDKALELWAIPPGQAPQSVGLVSPEGLTALRRAQGLAGVQQLAITLEPPGGSPTGAPTGPVIMSGDVLRI
ncbi:MAG: anti-sigma factor [Achromobacter sp.]|nr:anti-sigma factor [Achromobacter sp.]